jgi:putative membrane protein
MKPMNARFAAMTASLAAMLTTGFGPLLFAQIPPIPTPQPNLVNYQDEQFIKQLSQDIGTSYILALAAKNRATKPAVRELGVQLTTGLQQAQQDVTTLSIKKGVILSNTLEAKSQTLVDTLSSASLDEFDSKYLETLLQYLPGLQKSCEAIVQTTADADLKAYAERLLPTIQARIDRIQAVRKDL